MSKDIKGYSIQNGIPTPDNPVEIKNIVKELLFMPRNELIKLLISQQQENKQLKDLQNSMDKQYAELENNWNELKEHFKKQTIDLEMKREDISADAYIDRKMFLKEVLSKMQEIESGKNE